MAQPDDSAYQQNPYGTQDPSALFAQLSQQNSQNNGVSQGLAVAGFNPAMQHAQQIQSQMSRILGSIKQGDDEDPLDYQLRQSKAVAQGFTSLDPQTAMRADQQTLRLQNAKAEQNKLKADTEYLSSEAKSKNLATAQSAVDPMVWVQMGKDKLGLPTANAVGNAVRLTDDNGKIRDGWSTEMQDELTKAGGMKPGMQAMRQSQYLAYLEKINEGKAYATVLGAQMRQQAMMGTKMSPDAIDSYAQAVIDRDQPPMKPPINTRNPAAVQNYNDYVAAIKAKGADPSTIDSSDYVNNTKLYNAFNDGPEGQSVRRFNVALTHANLLRQYVANMKDGQPMDVPLVNYFRTAWQKSSGKPMPPTVDAMKDFVADEWTQAIISSRNGAALADRAAAQSNLTRNASSSQINSVLDGWQALGSGQLDGLHQQFRSGLQGVPAAKVESRWNAKLSQEAQDEYTKTGGGRTAPIAPPAGGARARITKDGGKTFYTVPESQLNDAIKAGWSKG
jgi:hypothetical protein